VGKIYVYEVLLYICSCLRMCVRHAHSSGLKKSNESPHTVVKHVRLHPLSCVNEGSLFLVKHIFLEYLSIRLGLVSCNNISVYVVLVRGYADIVVLQFLYAVWDKRVAVFLHNIYIIKFVFYNSLCGSDRRWYRETVFRLGLCYCVAK
jgi:hypothetical protein